LRPNELIPTKRLNEDRYRQVLCYPKHDSKEMRKRLKELKKLRVTAIEFTGDKLVFDVPVLGKGCIGIVVVVHTSSEKDALKIRRVDANRVGMQHEAEMLRRANAINVGPKLLNFTENFLLMEFIDGTLLPQWVEALRGRGTRSRIRRVLRALLEQCYRLDEAGLDHGELSRALRHIIVDSNDRPHLVDFETSSFNRRVSNVTSLCQFLFIGSQVAKTIKRKLGKIDEKELVNALRNYKQERTRENIKAVLDICRLHKV
jgi:putative serine/threonine protein kinase